MVVAVFSSDMHSKSVTALLAVLLSATPAIAIDKISVQHSDIILVVNSNTRRLPLVHASRDYRVGLTTYIALESKLLVDESNADPASAVHLETYLYWPDRDPIRGHVFKPGDTRWLVAPFLVHRLLKGRDYKWLLLGDDDTVWLVSGVRLLLSSFDWKLPYAISDHFGDNNNRGYFRPSPYAAACLPCHTRVVETQSQAGSGLIVPSLGCPCTPALACQLRQKVCANRGDCGPRKNFTGSSTQLCRFSWAHGGAGMVMSQALLLNLSATESFSRQTMFLGLEHDLSSATRGKQRNAVVSLMGKMGMNEHNATKRSPDNQSDWNFVMTLPLADASHDIANIVPPWSRMEVCVRSKSISSCDMMMARCLFEAGFGLTMTEYSWKLTGQYNNASYQVFDNHEHRVYLANPIAAVPPNTDDDSRPHPCSLTNETYCMWLLEHAVSVHMSARSYASMPAAVAALVTLMHSHAAARAVAGLR